jgi:putative transposase
VSQKLGYIHQNPTQTKWNLSATPEEYKWSSAAFYAGTDMNWSFSTHFWLGEDYTGADFEDKR